MNYELNFVYLRMRLPKLILFLLAFLPVYALSQDFCPNVVYTDVDGNTTECTYGGEMSLSETKEAPLHGEFHANGTDLDGWNVTYNWVVRVDTTSQNPEEAFEIIHRYDSTLVQDFKMKGTYYISFSADCTNPKTGDEVHFPADADSTVFSFSLSGSELHFPNTFIPDDPSGGYNTFKASSYKSIIEFHAIVFNRWGQKLYSWDDVREGWDGKIGGSYAKNGAYYLVVNAKGAEGAVYHIKKVINILKYTEDTGSDTGTSDN